MTDWVNEKDTLMNKDRNRGTDRDADRDRDKGMDRDADRDRDKGMDRDKDIDRDKAYRSWLYQAAGVGSRGLLKSLNRIGTPEEIFEMARKNQLEKRLSEKYKAKAEKITASAAGFDVMAQYEKMVDRGIAFVALGEADYPKKLASVPDAPYALYYVGKMPKDEEKTIAIIGARECSEYGRAMAEQFGRILAEAGVQIISGMARGIDGIGQQAAVEAGGYSMGVLGCGVDICYPAEHRTLYERLIAEGGICSEYPPGMEPRAMLFPPRNRIISGLSDGVLVIEAKERSGTLITVDMALEQGREVYALPGRATDPLSRGCNSLIRQGAELVASPQELLRELKPDCRQEMPYEQQSFTMPDGVQGQLLELLDFQPKSMETLQKEYAGVYGRMIPVPELCRELLQLCVAGYARQISGSYYVRKE